MDESATQERLKALDVIQESLLRAVHVAGAEFHASVNGQREAAAARFSEALQTFSDLIIRHQSPKSQVSAINVSEEGTVRSESA
jgi:hypothetical protein